MYINILLVIAGIFADPGIKKETYLYYTKKLYDGNKDLESKTKDDLETSNIQT